MRINSNSKRKIIIQFQPAELKNIAFILHPNNLQKQISSFIGQNLQKNSLFRLLKEKRKNYLILLKIIFLINLKMILDHKKQSIKLALFTKHHDLKNKYK